MQRINIIVTCTKRKRVLPNSDLHLRDVCAADLQQAFLEWRSRLIERPSEEIPARSLYAGDHWSVVQSLEGIAQCSGLSVAIWVCSAGYGLIGIDSEIKPYSATLSVNHPDSVFRWHQRCGDLNVTRSWWRLQAGWREPESRHPRSISEVAASTPDSPLVVVASRDYLRAIGGDVKRASKLLHDPARLSIISTGTKSLPGLEENLVPSSAALQRDLGGSLHSLNVRLARSLLAKCREGEFYAPILSAKVRNLLSAIPPHVVSKRKRMTDQEIQDYIAGCLDEDPESSWSSLLRRLRQSGRACKQERFASIFRLTAAEFEERKDIHRSSFN